MASEISIVIPVWSDAYTLPHCVTSCLGISDDIILILDADNRDDSEDVATALAAAHPSVQLITCQQRLGDRKARLRGAAAARHPLILFLDADDVLVDNFSELLPELVAAAKLHGRVSLRLTELWGDLDHIGREDIVDECHSLIKRELLDPELCFPEEPLGATAASLCAFHLCGVKPAWRMALRDTDAWATEPWRWRPPVPGARWITFSNPWRTPAPINASTYPGYPARLKAAPRRFRVAGDVVLDNGAVPPEYVTEASDADDSLVIFIKTCVAYENTRLAAQWATWLRRLPPGYRVIPYTGGGANELDDAGVLRLGCPDDYGSLRAKSWLAMKWALVHTRCRRFVTIDDDLWMSPQFVQYLFSEHAPYTGAMLSHGYANGLAYSIDRRLLPALIAALPLMSHELVDDVAVGTAMLQLGVQPHRMFHEPIYRGRSGIPLPQGRHCWPAAYQVTREQGGTERLLRYCEDNWRDPSLPYTP